MIKVQVHLSKKFKAFMKTMKGERAGGSAHVVEDLISKQMSRTRVQTLVLPKQRKRSK
jgi:hypothetical protein